MNSTKVIIIGAPRSGTNMLRDVLCALPGVDTWPCDEINYIWRHGNMHSASDEFTADMATPKVRDFINKKIDGFALNHKLNVLVEKTCANSLRVPFVDAVVPDAKYIYIVRNGYDVLASAKQRWHADFDLSYIMKKARYVPISDLPYYGGRYLANHIFRMFSKEKRLAFWGPAFKDMNECMTHHSLEEMCALQWKRCVDLSDAAFQEMPEEKWHRVYYEDFVNNPRECLFNILHFLQKDVDEPRVLEAVANVRVTSVGKGRNELGHSLVSNISPLIQATLERHGYV